MIKKAHVKAYYLPEVFVFTSRFLFLVPFDEGDDDAVAVATAATAVTINKDASLAATGVDRVPIAATATTIDMLSNLTMYVTGWEGNKYCQNIIVVTYII